jgi:chemotaxis family two-component system response regulator Rcp1
VEDTHGDVRLTEEAFREASSFIRIHVVIDGLQVMGFLRRRGKYESAPRPDLILLDLSLPFMNGREVLSIIKKDESLKSVPVFILTCSDAEADVTLCNQYASTRYHRKPVHWDGFESLARDICDLWRVKDKVPQPAPRLYACRVCRRALRRG